MTVKRLGPRTFTFAGTVNPKRAGHEVVLYRNTASGVVAVAHAVTDKYGRYVIKHSFRAYGRHTYKTFVRVTATATLDRTNSRTVEVTSTRRR